LATIRKNKLDADRWGRVVEFFSTFLHHIKGEWAKPDEATGEIPPFELAPWQKNRIIKPLFGKIKPDGTRQYRTVYIEVPRKNGKSTLASAVGLSLLFVDREPGAEIYSAAADKDQARIVFEPARQMVLREPELADRCTVYKDAIEFDGAVYRVISADAYTKHGLNAHGVIFDELHAQPNRDLYDVLTTSTGSRAQPVTFMMTTAGYDKLSICYEVHDYSLKVEQGLIEDPTWLSVIYAADLRPVEQGGPGDDWHDPKVWRKANPNLGTSKRLEYMEEKHAYAVAVPGYENTFKRLDLNVWTEQASRWLPMDLWNEDKASASFKEGWFKGRKCFGGLDLASTTDLASFCLVSRAEDGHYRAIWRHWIAAENAEARMRRDKVPYPVWAQQGWIKLTEGNVIDYDVIREDIKKLAERFEIEEVAYDRWNAQQLVTQLEGDGLTMVPMGMGFASLSAPSKLLENLILGKLLRHGGNPVASWCASNAAVETDSTENKKPSRKHSTEKIDAVITLVIALGRAMLQPEPKRSVYETRGIRTL
jgi:phage terminase large subunit-like protein